MPFVANRLVVASRLALRWAAKQPLLKDPILSGRMGSLVLGLLRSPTQGKPARHRGRLRLALYQNNTFATSAKRLAKCTVMPSFRYSGNSSKLPRLGSGKINS